MRTAILLILAVLAAAACYEKQPITGTGDTIFMVRTEPSSATIPADGVSRIRIIARIVPPADPDKRKVTFETTAGTLIGGTGTSATSREVVADGNGEAAIDLQSTQTAQTVVVSARPTDIAGIIARVEIQFAAAAPEAVIVTSSKFVVKPEFADSTDLTIQLRRSDGMASGGEAISLTARTAQGAPIGRFQSDVVFASTAGTATAKYSAGPTSYVGEITITATVVGTSVSGSTVINVAP